jgi:hypothetical protein
MMSPAPDLEDLDDVEISQLKHCVDERYSKESGFIRTLYSEREFPCCFRRFDHHYLLGYCPTI